MAVPLPFAAMAAVSLPLALCMLDAYTLAAVPSSRGSPASLADAPLFSSKHRDPWARSVQQLTGSSELGGLSYGLRHFVEQLQSVGRCGGSVPSPGMGWKSATASGSGEGR